MAGGVLGQGGLAMGSMIGADVDDVERAGRELTQSAKQVGSMPRGLRSQLHSTPWRGRAAEQFRQDWNQAHGPAIAEAAEFLRLAGEELGRQARDQRHASLAGSSRAGRPHGAGGGPSRPRTPLEEQVLSTRHKMQTDLDEAKNRLAELEERRRPTGVGNWIADRNPLDESNSERLDREIAEQRSKVDRLTKLLADPSRQFLKVDASGDGRIIEVYGDLAKADRVAIHVPGMGNSIDNYLGGNGHTDASALYDKLSGWTDGTGEQVAVVSFLDYDAPDGLKHWTELEGNARAGAEAAGEGLARDGATNLRSLVTDLDRHGVDSTKITVVAHSYGSVVTGLALRDGLDVERAVVVGSPGLGRGIDRYSDLQTGADLWVGAAWNDYVPYSSIAGAHGTAPQLLGYGGNRFSTGEASIHSEYFKGTSLNNIGGIVMGDLDR